MSEMFNSLYDEIFLQTTSSVLDKDKINDITGKYMGSNINTFKKKNFLKLRREYLKIKSIKNYKELQGKLYSGKSRKDIILFEVARILNSPEVNADILEQIANIDKLVSMNDVNSDRELYDKIVNVIIRTEISLGMKIGLFEELCCLFEKEIKQIDEKLEITDLSYTRSR